MRDWRKQRDTVDLSAPTAGAEKSQRMDLGLELLSIARAPGLRLSCYEIAAWCGCTDSAIYRLEKRAMRKLANALKFGSRSAVGTELVSGPTKQPRIGADQARNILARQWTNNARGPLGVPDSIVREWHRNYMQSGSLQATAEEFGRTKQNLAYVFKRRGLAVKSPGGPNHTKNSRDRHNAEATGCSALVHRTRLSTPQMESSLTLQAAR